MRVLVLGAGGMLGHKLVQRLSRRFEVAATLRAPEARPPERRSLSGARVFTAIDARDDVAIGRVLDDFRPAVLFNAVGIVKQVADAADPVVTIAVNALLPHRLARLAAPRGIRVVQFGTDCVFSGDTGPNREEAPPDARDLYGRSKLLGELAGKNCLTIRSSFIGHGAPPGAGLVDWFMGQRRGRVPGYAHALYTGLTTLSIADLCATLVAERPELEGVWQVSADAISKLDLLQLIDATYGLGIDIVADESFRCDRRLDSRRFRDATGWRPKPWAEMIADMRADAIESGDIAAGDR